MKYLIPFRVYEAQKTSDLTLDQEDFLTTYTWGTWSVNRQTGLVDVEGSFNCSGKGLKTLSGISFGHVSGNFYCNSNQLTSPEGAPRTVGGDFYCFSNQLTSLKGAPQTVGGDFWCFYNQLTSLEGAPQTVDGNFYCYDNQLTSLEGAPQTVGGVFPCDKFKLGRGEWNMEGWLEVLNTGTEEAKRLILTLPVFQPEYWNSKIGEQPKETILQMVPIWDDLPKETQDRIQIPSNLKDGFDNLLDLYRAGIF